MNGINIYEDIAFAFNDAMGQEKSEWCDGLKAIQNVIESTPFIRMEDPKFRKYRKKNIEITGSNWQLSKLAEECNELAAAIQKLSTKNGPMEDVFREAADVEVCLEHLSDMFGRDIIQDEKNKKYERIRLKVEGIPENEENK